MKTIQRSILGIIIFLALWQLLSLILNASSILPAPLEVFKELFHLLLEPATIYAAWQTAWKVFLTLILVLVLGITIGLFMGLFPPLYDMLRPIILVIQAVPVISWLSLVIFAWGIGWEGPVFIAFMSLVPVALLTTVSGVKNLDKNLLEMAQVYNVTKRKVFRDIYLGSLVPFIIAIIDVSLGQAWKVILVAEYLSGNSGLGVHILAARYTFYPAKVWAYTLIAVLLGLITERIIKYYLGRISKRWAAA